MARSSEASASRGSARILVQKLAIALALYGWFAVFALYLARQLGFSLTQTDYLFSIFAVFNVIMNAVVVGRVSARLGDRMMSNLGLASLVGGFRADPVRPRSRAARGDDDALRDSGWR